IRLRKRAVIKELRLRLEQPAKLKGPWLLMGAKGSGAERCARVLHLPDTPLRGLTETERRTGGPVDIVEECREGVVFIPEVAALNKTEQKGLLLLQSKAEKYGVRVVCATTHALNQLVIENQFDESLLQALSVATLSIPSLRDHPEDIPD